MKHLKKFNEGWFSKLLGNSPEVGDIVVCTKNAHFDASRLSSLFVKGQEYKISMVGKNSVSVCSIEDRENLDWNCEIFNTLKNPIDEYFPNFNDHFVLKKLQGSNKHLNPHRALIYTAHKEREKKPQWTTGPG